MQFIAVAILTFLCVPIFINKLGLEAYGVFALITILGNLNFFSSFGLNSALLVFISKQGKTEESQRDIVVVLFSTIVIAVILCSLLYIFKTPIIENIFGVPQEYLQSSGKLYDYLLLANLLLIVGQVAVSIIDALQKMYISNIIQFIYNLIYWIGLIVVVARGGNLSEVGIPLLLSAVVWFVLIFWKARLLWGSFRLTQPLRPHLKRVFFKQFSYGAKIFTAGFCGFFLEPLSKILISKFTGIDLVAFYDIALRIKHQVAGLFQKATYPLFP
ncbi:MAG: oligosaccharide flippase family protein, partial [Clostridia bacterium]|nr:oligosaccharide flippase family protein [Clostridia bacterium]